MYSIHTYMEYRNNTSFFELPFSDVDILAFNIIAYLDFSWLGVKRIRFQDAAKAYIALGKTDTTDPRHEEEVLLLKLMSVGKRYRNVYLENPVKDINEKEEKTFYAVTFALSPFMSLVCFRGTDNSLISWKENFTFAYKKPAEGQVDAVNYVDNALKNPFRRVIISGHSKGGHLTLYSASRVEKSKQKRIKSVVCLDAFSLPENLQDYPGYKNIEPKIRGFVPHDCIIGNVFCPEYKKTIVSCEVDGFAQHNIIYWKVNAKGLVTCENVSEYGLELSSALNNWILSVSEEDYIKTVSEIFHMFDSANIHDFDDLERLTPPGILSLLKSFITVSKGTRDFMIVLSQCMSKKP